MARSKWHDEDEEVALTVRLPASVHARLRAAAAERVVGVNVLTAKAIGYYLDRLPPVDP